MDANSPSENSTSNPNNNKSLSQVEQKNTSIEIVPHASHYTDDPKVVLTLNELENPITKKVGKNLLTALREKNRIEEAHRSKELEILTQELVDKIKQDYVQKLTTTGRDLLKNQFITTECIAKDENTFECICSMHLQYNSINNLKQDLSDFILQQIYNPKLKVITTLVESEGPVAHYVLSKSEIFEEYINKFPILKSLKEELFLTVKGSYDYEPISQPAVAEIDKNTASIEENLEDLLEENDD